MTESQFRLLLCIAVALLGAAAYLNTVDGEWVWDDVSSVLLHKNVQDPGKLLQLFREDQHAFGGGQGNFYRPLVSVSFMADFLVSYDAQRDAAPGRSHPDLKPFIFHITNILWHVAAALLLFALLTRLEAPRFVRGIVPLLYVVHPLHTEAVAYISGRADMMSAAFMYAGLLFALTERPNGKPLAAWALSALCFCAALLSKESSLIFPVLLAVIVLLRPHPSRAEAAPRVAYLRRYVPLAISAMICTVYALLRMTVLKFAESGGGEAHPFGQRLVETCQAFTFYIRMLFLPTGLHMEQTLAATPQWTAAIGVLLLIACVLILFLAVRARQHRIALGMGWFLAAWLPISGIFPLNAPMAEHWMYVPMAGFWWVCAELAYLGACRPKVRAASMAFAYGLCAVFLVLTVQRNQDWHNNERLFRSTIAANPDTIRANYNLAVAYEDLLGNLPGARRHFENVLALNEAEKRTESDVHLSLGNIYLEQGEFMRAFPHFNALLALPDTERYRAFIEAANLGLGRCFLALGDVARAGFHFQQAATINPANLPGIQAILQGGPIMRRR